MLDGTIAKALLVILVAFAFYVIKEYRNSIDGKLKSHGELIDKNTKSFRASLDVFRKSLAQHTHDFNKTEKNIAEESLRLREGITSITVDIKTDINQTKIDIVKLSKALETVSLNVEKYCAALNDGNGKVYSLEKYINKNKADIGSVLRVLEMVKKDYGKIRLISEKNSTQTKILKNKVEKQAPIIGKIEKAIKASKKRG